MVIAVFFEHDRLKKDVRQIDVGVAVHDLDDAARSIFGEVSQCCDDVGAADLVHNVISQQSNIQVMVSITCCSFDSSKRARTL